MRYHAKNIKKTANPMNKTDKHCVNPFLINLGTRNGVSEYSLTCYYSIIRYQILFVYLLNGHLFYFILKFVFIHYVIYTGLKINLRFSLRIYLIIIYSSRAFLLGEFKP